MSDFIPIPWGNRFLRASRTEFDAMLERGLDPGPTGAPAPAPVAEQRLLTSEALALALSLTPEYCEQQARTGEWPSHRIGKYLRFSLTEVLAAIATTGNKEMR